MNSEIIARNGVQAVHVEQLQHALADENLHALLAGAPPNQAGQQAALQAAIALGYCRLFGADLGEEDGALPLPVAWAAARALQDLIAETIRDAENLASDWDSTDVSWERDELCVRLLQSRMDIHAAYIAVDEAMLEAYGENELSWEQYDRILDSLTEKLEELDRILQQPENLEILSTVSSLPLLENWRTLLAGDYAVLVPWWLSGVLSEATKLSAETALKSMPSPQTWQALARTIAEKEQQKSVLLKSLLLLALRPRVAAAAPEQPVIIRWVSPDRDYEAHCVLVLRDKSPEQIQVIFMTASGEAAEALYNQPVWLADLEVPIGSDGSASFPSGTLLGALESGAFPHLLIGHNKTLWDFDINSIPPNLTEKLAHESGTND